MRVSEDHFGDSPQAHLQPGSDRSRAPLPQPPTDSYAEDGEENLPGPAESSV